MTDKRTIWRVGLYAPNGPYIGELLSEELLHLISKAREECIKHPGSSFGDLEQQICFNHGPLGDMLQLP